MLGIAEPIISIALKIDWLRVAWCDPETSGVGLRGSATSPNLHHNKPRMYPLADYQKKLAAMAGPLKLKSSIKSSSPKL